MWQTGPRSHALLLFLFISLSLHLQSPLHIDTRALPAVCIRCLKYLLSLLSLSVPNTPAAHCTWPSLFPFTHIMSVCLQFLFFSLIPFSLNVRVLIVYRNHKFGCHWGARCVSLLTFWSRGTKYNKVWRIILNVIFFYFFRKCPGAAAFSKHEERFSNLLIEGLYSGL